MELKEWLVGIGHNIREERKKQGLTQEQLAELASVDVSYIGGIERGRREPSLKILWRLSSTLQAPLFRLLNVVDEGTSDTVLAELTDLLNDLTPEKQEKILQAIRIISSL